MDFLENLLPDGCTVQGSFDRDWQIICYIYIYIEYRQTYTRVRHDVRKNSLFGKYGTDERWSTRMWS